MGFFFGPSTLPNIPSKWNEFFSEELVTLIYDFFHLFSTNIPLFSHKPIKDQFRATYSTFPFFSPNEICVCLITFCFASVTDDLLTKLQKAMGHSSIKVSLTNLRGLEVPELTEEDMPLLQKTFRLGGVNTIASGRCIEQGQKHYKQLQLYLLSISSNNNPLLKFLLPFFCWLLSKYTNNV